MSSPEGPVTPASPTSPTSPNPQALILAKGLRKEYGDFTAVDGIDFQVNRGESFGFLGPNGAGKSTTMRIIAATLTRTSGEITILGQGLSATLVQASSNVTPHKI